MTSPQKTLVLFDIDGTLLYSNGLDSSSFTQTYEERYQVHFPTINFSDYPHVSDHTIFSTIIQQDFNRLPDQEEIDAFQEHYVNMIIEKRKRAPHHYMEVPGAKKAMDLLLGNPEFCVGIATGGWKKPATIKLQHLGFDTTHLFDSYADNKATREEIVQEAIDKARAKHGAAIKRIVYIGDAHWDVTTTRNMGLNFVGIRLKGDHEELIRHGVDHVLSDFTNYEIFHHHLHQSTPPK